MAPKCLDVSTPFSVNDSGPTFNFLVDNINDKIVVIKPVLYRSCWKFF